ncbi:hypothetical protein [Nocardioides sp. WS12]|uniref:hypothetical protein n=1 Tax=Nocardioides sp. WS12 TaxID=2486272 RepID=UPI0015FD506F|nr:hypothetical protein [Nocardioides sp. WS12]
MAMNGSDSGSGLDAVMNAHPQLNAFGIGAFDSRKKSPEERRAYLADGRAALKRREAMVMKVTAWLRANISPIKTPSVGSYRMKHVAERALAEYVSNGELIAAALIAGYPVKYSEGPNANLGMSKRDVDSVDARRSS